MGQTAISKQISRLCAAAEPLEDAVAVDVPVLEVPLAVGTASRFVGVAASRGMVVDDEVVPAPTFAVWARAGRQPLVVACGCDGDAFSVFCVPKLKRPFTLGQDGDLAGGTVCPADFSYRRKSLPDLSSLTASYL